MKTLLLFLLLASVSTKLLANQPYYYSFPFFPSHRAELPPGQASVVWAVGSDAFENRVQNQTLEGKRFVATVMNLFEEVLYSDTVESPIMHVTIKKDEHVLLHIRELGDTVTRAYDRPLLLSSRGKPLPAKSSTIDSLNFMLLNGYFANALTTLHHMHRDDLIAEVLEQHALLFPFDYGGSREIFNSYYDSASNDLVQMPYVANTKKFLKKLKGAAVPKIRRFEIYATIGENNNVESVETIPPANNQFVADVLKLLQINTHNVKSAKLALVINTKKWKLVNSRALTNPASNAFKLRPRLVATGAVHR
jgi:hypothetical protein